MSKKVIFCERCQTFFSNQKLKNNHKCKDPECFLCKRTFGSRQEMVNHRDLCMGGASGV